MVVEILSPSSRKRKRVEPFQCSSQGRGFFCLRSLDPNAQVITPFAASSSAPIRLLSNRVYTVGRQRRFCEITFLGNRRISKRHCQFFLDGFRRRLVVVDGLMDLGSSGSSGCTSESFSLNGVFVNGRKIQKGTIFELSVGDEVLLACGGLGHRSGALCGFVVEKVAFIDQCCLLNGETPKSSSMDLTVRELRCRESIKRGLMLLSICRSILRSVDPVLYIHRSLHIDTPSRKAVAEEATAQSLAASMELFCEQKSNETLKPSDNEEAKFVCLPDPLFQDQDVSTNPPKKDSLNVASDVSCPLAILQYSEIRDKILQPSEDGRCNIPSDGKALFLNRLQFMDPRSSEHGMAVSLPQLLHPVESLTRVFIATFTCNVSWFLSFCNMPNHLPITIACHNAERCWDTSSGSRISMPFPEYPNLVLIYPPFPESIAFGTDRKSRGVGCHHPKLIILQRENTIRIIITSANLVSRQWNNITNTVWWQDFPRRDTADFSPIFSRLVDDEKDEGPGFKSDFAAQLAGFVASLITDVSKEAYWILELTKYDFGGAIVHLVASVPGIHAQVSPSQPNYFLSLMETMHSKPLASNYIGCVQTSVVGISHRFRATADSNGSELLTLASLLQKKQLDTSVMLEVLLRRATNIPADSNAVSVLVSASNESSGASVLLGFLPRDVAKWVAPLSDNGLFSFSAFILPKEALAAAFEGSNNKVQLVLYITQGPNFSQIAQLLEPELLSPVCSLIASLGKCLGLSRLQEILCRYTWPESLETDFVYGCSSIGTSICPQYLASFSAATGKKSHQLSDSESDPEWGRWTTKHEVNHPSLGILFPTIERVKAGPHGIQSCRYMLAFSEKTWQRLKCSSILHDSIPTPQSRVGYPMHVKVARRRFQSKRGTSFGWIYCGSHNFSPAAWGQPLQYPSAVMASQAVGTATLGPILRICNYELGIIFVVPPPKTGEHRDGDSINLDDIKLPFVVPAPRYSHHDRPATAQAMREVALLEKERSTVQQAAEDEVDEEISDDEEECVEYVAEENKEERIYAEMLWSQLDSSEGP